MGTWGSSLTKAPRVPSPPTATRQRQRLSRLDSATMEARSAGVQAIWARRPDLRRALTSWQTLERPLPRPEPALAAIPTQGRPLVMNEAGRGPRPGFVEASASDILRAPPAYQWISQGGRGRGLAREGGGPGQGGGDGGFEEPLDQGLVFLEGGHELFAE